MMLRGTRRASMCLLVIVAGSVALPARVAAAPSARVALVDCVQPGEQATEVPWHERMLQPERVWPFAIGRGVVVAVLGTGVDAGQAQLSGRVAAGFNAVAGSGSADTDCLGDGTHVAGVIAAQRNGPTGVAGLAPAATILPVRVVDDQRRSTSAVLASGINFAVDKGVDVIALTVSEYSDAPELRLAVARALTSDVVVVAAVGDVRSLADSPTPYPAVYDGVLGVGAIDADAHRWLASPAGTYVDLVAPGVGVVTLQPGGGVATLDGTALAAGFVAGSAALLRERLPAATNSEIIRRLLATATPAPGSPRDAAYGYGIVNPYAALNDRVNSGATGSAPDALAMPTQVREEARVNPAVLMVAGVLLTAFVVFASALVLPRGRRRLWRPVLADPMPSRHEPTDPRPPALLFDSAKPVSEGRPGRQRPTHVPTDSMFGDV